MLTVAGIVHLIQDDELELVVTYQPSALISMEPDVTHFGVVQLNWNNACEDDKCLVLMQEMANWHTTVWADVDKV